jgi:hypothetical protein
MLYNPVISYLKPIKSKKMRNKTIVMAVITATVFFSCKKERSCECITMSASTIFYPSNDTVTYTYKKISKKQIKTLCKSYTGTSRYQTVIVDCSLK